MLLYHVCYISMDRAQIELIYVSLETTLKIGTDLQNC